MRIRSFFALVPLFTMQFTSAQPPSSIDGCSPNLVSQDEALAALQADLAASFAAEPDRTISDFEVVHDAKRPNLVSSRVIDDPRDNAPRKLVVLRGYARLLQRRGQPRAIFYSDENFWGRPASGVIYDANTGRALEVLGLNVAGPRDYNSYGPGHWTALDLQSWLQTRLVGSDPADQHAAFEPAPRWAEPRFKQVAIARLSSAIITVDDLVTPDHRIDLAKLGADPAHQKAMARMIKQTRFAVPTAEAGEPPRGRLIIDMPSNGYGPQWLNSFELQDVLERIKPLTRGRYVLTLFWDSKNIVDVVDGDVRFY